MITSLKPTEYEHLETHKSMTYSNQKMQPIHNPRKPSGVQKWASTDWRRGIHAMV